MPAGSTCLLNCPVPLTLRPDEVAGRIRDRGSRALMVEMGEFWRAAPDLQPRTAAGDIDHIVAGGGEKCKPSIQGSFLSPCIQGIKYTDRDAGDYTCINFSVSVSEFNYKTKWMQTAANAFALYISNTLFLLEDWLAERKGFEPSIRD